MDRRRQAQKYGNTNLPRGTVDETRMTLTLDPDYFEEEGSIELEPFQLRYEVCSVCEGRGSYVNPSIDENGISGEEFHGEWDEDEREAYLGGAYDVTCACCMGKRVMLVPVLTDGTPEAEWYREWQEDQAHDRSEREYEERYQY